MNRVIKFRVWCKQNEVMKSVARIGFIEDKLWYVEDEDHETQPPYFYDDDDWALMQYTGLKDKNGKEIYEGDIVKGKNYGFNNPIRFIGTVEYSYNHFKVIGCRNKYKGVSDELNTTYEVIGNMFENPELLEGGKHE